MSVKAWLDGTIIRLENSGCSLYEQSGYGRPEKGGLRLSAEEACYLLYKKRIEVKGFDFDSILAFFTKDPSFLRVYLVYRDLRERGYAVQTGPHDFRVFKRGQRPGTGQSLYTIRVLSERDLITFDRLISETASSTRMRKHHILAIVDDESELTYYEVKINELSTTGTARSTISVIGNLVGYSAIVHPADVLKDKIPSLGMNLDPERLLLSPLEIAYLMKNGILTLQNGEEAVGYEQFINSVSDKDHEFFEKTTVYQDLRDRGYIPRTGYKFGHHFRVYSGKKLHSELLVHAIGNNIRLPMSTISRSVRLANSVKKKMLFAYQHTTGIQYVEFAWMKL